MVLLSRPSVGGRHRAAHRGARPDYWRAVLVALLLLGWALRVRQYAFRRSLWDDEASVALNIIHKGYLGLTRPLDILQGAPFGWLWTERLSFQLLGNGEYQLRLPALAAGLLLMWWTYRLVRLHLSGPAGAVALLLVGVSPALVYYGSEVKPYGVDAAAAVGLVLAASKLDLGQPRGAFSFAGAAAVAVLFSFPALYVCAAITAVASLVALRRGDLRLLGSHVAGAVAWLGVFAVEYVRSLEPTANSSAMKSFWASGYPPRPLSLSGLVRWLGGDGFAVGRYPLDASLPIAALVMLAAGLLALWLRGHRPAAGVVVMILGLLVVGAVIRAYPMRDRMVLFAVPLVLIAMAASIDLVRQPGLRTVAMAATVAAMAGTVPRAFDALGSPYNHTEFRAAYLYAGRHERPGDTIWADYWANTEYAYYEPIFHIRIQAHWHLEPQACGRPVAQLQALRPGSRLWVIFATPPDVGIDIPAALGAFAQIGHLDLWKPTSTGAGVASFTVGAHPPAQIHSPLGCLDLTPPASYH